MESSAISTESLQDAPAGPDASPHPIWNFAFGLAWVAIYFTALLPRARDKPFWYDEIFTWHLARLPSLGRLWECLREGTDPNPPLYYAAAHLMHEILGAAPWTTRLPAMLGYLLMSLCLYRFARRRVSGVFAWTAATFPLITEASSYAIEARAYGLVLGLGALALLCWQVAAEEVGFKRGLALILLPLSLAAAVASHYFAVLLFIPIGVGELCRSWHRKKIDVALWCSLIAGLLPLGVLYQLIKGATSYKGAFWSKPGWSFVLQCYAQLFEKSAIPITAIGLLIALDARYPYRWRRAEVPGADMGAPAAIPTYEYAAAMTYVLLPLIGLAFARVAAGGAFTERYTLAFVYGFGLLVAYSTARLGSRRRYLAAMITACCLGWFAGFEMLLHQRDGAAINRITAADFPRADSTDEPLVISWSVMFLQAKHELPRSLADRTYFLCGGGSTDEAALKKLNDLVKLNVQNFEPFVAEHKKFFLCGFSNDYVLQELMKSRAKLTYLGARRFRHGEVLIFEVDCS